MTPSASPSAVAFPLPTLARAREMLLVPLLATAVYATVYAALSFVMHNPHFMLAMVPIGAYQNMQVGEW